jgi:hypothetical protein
MWGPEEMGLGLIETVPKKMRILLIDNPTDMV